MMHKQIFSNATILAGEDLEITEGYLCVRGGTIQEISEGTPPNTGIDLHRGIVLPSFVNAHTHLGDSVKKDIYLRKTQPEVVGPAGEKFKVLRSSSRRSKIEAIRSSIRDMIKSGTLAHCDFCEEGIRGVRIFEDAKLSEIRSVVLSRPINLGWHEKLLKESDGIGLPSLNSLEEEKIRRIAKQVEKAGKFFASHVAETKEAQKASVENTGSTEIRRSLEFDPSFLVHGTWATDEDLAAMHRKDVPLVVCGRSNSLLGVGVPPLKKALEEEVKLWVGTDNATVCQPNMFRELSFLWALLRRECRKAGSDEAKALLKAATINPSSGLDLSFGAIEEGSNATFLVVARGENLRHIDDIYVGLVNRGRVDNIRMIFKPDERSRLQDIYKCVENKRGL